MVVDEVVVVAGTDEVVVVEDVALGGSDASGSSDGAEVELVLLVALVPLIVLGGATVTAGSDASSAPSTDGEPCASATSPAASEAVVAFSDCVVVTVTPPAPAAIVEGLLSLPDEQATANRAIIKNAAVDAGFEGVIANLLL